MTRPIGKITLRTEPRGLAPAPPARIRTLVRDLQVISEGLPPEDRDAARSMLHDLLAYVEAQPPGMAGARQVQATAGRTTTLPTSQRTAPRSQDANPVADADRVRVLCVLFRAPPTLADEINAAGMGFTAAFRLLNSAAGGATHLNSTAVMAVQLGLQAVAFARRASRGLR